MAHLIILDKTKNLTKRVADANLELIEAGEHLHTLDPMTEAWSDLDGAINALAGALDDWQGELDTQLAAIAAMCE